MHKSFRLTKLTKQALKRFIIVTVAVILFFIVLNYLALYNVVYYGYKIAETNIELGTVTAVLISTYYRDQNQFRAPYELSIGMYVDKNNSKEIQGITLRSLELHYSGGTKSLYLLDIQSFTKHKGVCNVRVHGRWVDGAQYWAKIGQYALPHEELKISCVMIVETINGNEEYPFEFTAIPYVRIETRHLLFSN